MCTQMKTQCNVIVQLILIYEILPDKIAPDHGKFLLTSQKLCWGKVKIPFKPVVLYNQTKSQTMYGF